MARTVAIGIQDFEQLIKNNYFYIDKTKFIKEWWERGDAVTLITRPRRFGKTLTMSMLEYFFSVSYAGRGALFEKLDIWQEKKYRNMQGIYPVISLSFATIKQTDYEGVRQRIYQILTDVYQKYRFVRDSDTFTDTDREYFDRISCSMNESDATYALHKLSEFLSRYYGRKVLILLDEYDTPMQEAYVHGYWDEIVSFIRNLFNATFKTNPYLERGIMTGITRVSRESIFSDLNNLKVVTATSDIYTDIFGFTEEEVFSAMDEQGYKDKEDVKNWYDGFIFGTTSDIYNPWSIINYLDTGKLSTYWANTSSNSLTGKLIRESSPDIKQSFEKLLRGENLTAVLDEQIVYNQLDEDENAIWSLLLAGGYLTAVSVNDCKFHRSWGETEYELRLTNCEVRLMFASMIRGWFNGGMKREYRGFVQALLNDDVKLMNVCMSKIVLNSISYFDTGNRPSGREPERFYHGLVLGLLVDLHDKYVVTSNRESGYGRYDVMLEPRYSKDAAVILEFKVHDPQEEQTLQETAEAACRQIEEKQYQQILVEKGIPEHRIRKYGFAFAGKKVFIGKKAAG